MQIEIMPDAKKDLDFWVKTGNKVILKKIALLIDSILEHTFEGVGKPEPLKHSLKGTWSRRINQEHRLIYELHNSKILIHSLKGHYD
ncbi:MAG: Txe/YoeB family addiction module toxin [Ginsengibacter sp.]